MGNIHGNCINSDELTRDGSTYLAKPRPDFLTANDAWFMPVAQKVGPDGCLYILDWYDRYHCYQDAGRDPAGIDRLRGRLYRVVYKDYKSAGEFDLNRESLPALIKRCGSANVCNRELAQRCISEFGGQIKTDAARDEFAAQMEKVITDSTVPRKARLHLLWAAGFDASSALQKHEDATFRAWAVRSAEWWAALNRVQFPDQDFEASLLLMLQSMVKDPSPDVKLRVAIATRQLLPDHAMPILLDVLKGCGDDKLIPHIVWQNLHPLLEKQGARFLGMAAKADLAKAPALGKVLPRAIDRILGNQNSDPVFVVRLVANLRDDDTEISRATANLCLKAIRLKVQNGEFNPKQLVALHKELDPLIDRISTFEPLWVPSVSLMASLKDPRALKVLRVMVASGQPEEMTLSCLETLTAAGDSEVLDKVGADLANPKHFSPAGRARMLSALGRLNEPRVAQVVLASYPKMEPELQPKAIDLMTERPAWSKRLLNEIAQKKIPSSALNANQVRKLLTSKDRDLVKQVTAVWGTLRTDRNPEREKIVAQMRDLIRRTPGDAKAGVQVFRKVCAECHKIYGAGAEVGPDVTSNGRSDFEQLLSNVFDPSLVIGAGYQATTVVTNAGQVLTGLVVEESPQRVVLKVQGGELKTVPRSSVDEIVVSKVSLMPEGLERQLQPQEIADLFAFLCLDRPPDDPTARKIPGTPR